MIIIYHLYLIVWIYEFFIIQCISDFWNVFTCIYHDHCFGILRFDAFLPCTSNFFCIYHISFCSRMKFTMFNVCSPLIFLMRVLSIFSQFLCRNDHDAKLKGEKTSWSLPVLKSCSLYWRGCGLQYHLPRGVPPPSMMTERTSEWLGEPIPRLALHGHSIALGSAVY